MKKRMLGLIMLIVMLTLTGCTAILVEDSKSVTITPTESLQKEP